MIQKMNNKPEEILLVSGVKEIGKAVNLNRERVALTILGIANEDYDLINQKFQQYTEDGEITDVEKPSLQRELDAIDRDFQLLRRETRENGLGDSDEYREYEDKYNQLSALLTKIINSVGTYGASDVYEINNYYTQYTSAATALGNLILETQEINSTIDSYYARTSVIVNIIPEAVPVNTTTSISAQIVYNGSAIDMTDISASAVSFGLTGLATGIQSSAFGLPTGASVVITELTHSAVVSNCKSFTLAYEGIGATGVNVTCQVILDSDSMPF